MTVITISPKVRIYYEISGLENKTPIILVHGLRTTLDWWNPTFIDNLVSFGNLKVIKLDLRGCGRSTNIDNHSFTIADLADDLIAVADDLGLDTFNVLGFSYGGRIIQTLLTKHPNRIEKAILASTICTIKKYPIREYRREMSSREFVESFLEKFFTKKFRLEHSKEVERFLIRATTHETPFITYQLQLQAILSFQGCDALKNIKHEVLIIHGTSDMFIPYKESIKIDRMLQNSTLYLIEDVGHLIFSSDKVKEVTQVILSFLKESNKKLSS